MAITRGILLAFFAALSAGLGGAGADLGRLHLSATDLDSGEHVPVRLRIVPAGVWSRPLVDGPRPLQTVDGRWDGSLVPGRYRVVVSRGPEWSVVRREITIVAGRTLSLHAQLRREVDPGRWISADLHLHTGRSRDSRIGDEARVASLVAEGVRFAVITDHNRVHDLGPAVARIGLAGELTVAPGVEITTWAPESGHFNAFPLGVDRRVKDGGAPRWLATDPARILAEVRARDPGALVQINHPQLEDHIGYYDLHGLDPASGDISPDVPLAFDTLEVWNGFELGSAAALRENFDDWLALVAAGHRLVATGSSDSHDDRRQLPGYPRTYIAGDPRDPSVMAAALRRGHAFVSTGPILDVSVQGCGPGETVTGSRPGVMQLTLRADAPRYIDVSLAEVFVGGERVRELAIRRGVATRVGLVIERDTFVVVLVRGERGLEPLLGRTRARPMAFSNPIWIDVSG